MHLPIDIVDTHISGYSGLLTKSTNCCYQVSRVHMRTSTVDDSKPMIHSHHWSPPHRGELLSFPQQLCLEWQFVSAGLQIKQHQHHNHFTTLIDCHSPMQVSWDLHSSNVSSNFIDRHLWLGTELEVEASDCLRVCLCESTFCSY